MQDIIDIITQNGIGVVCVGFMIYFINTTLKDNNKILDEMQKTLISIQTTLGFMQDRIERLENNTKGIEKDERNWYFIMARFFGFI